jgi:hypothetical protein
MKTERELIELIDNVAIKPLDSEQIEKMVREVCSALYGSTDNIDYTDDDVAFYSRFVKMIEQHYGIE